MQSSWINGGRGMERCCFIHLSSQETALYHGVNSTMAVVTGLYDVPDFAKKASLGQRIPYFHHLSSNTYSNSSTIIKFSLN